MVEVYVPPASIECQAAFLKFRHFQAYPPKYDKKLKRQVYKFALRRDSLATVEKELNPKKTIYRESSLLEKNDTIRGKQISVICDRPIKEKNTDVKKGSATHKAGHTKTKAYTFAKLERAFPNTVNT